MSDETQPVVLPKPLDEMTDDEIDRFFRRPGSEKPELLKALATPDGLRIELSPEAAEEFRQAVSEFERHRQAKK